MPFPATRTGAPPMPDERIVRIRAERLLASWGRDRAVPMAERYLIEAERGGNPDAIALSDAVLAALMAARATDPVHRAG